MRTCIVFNPNAGSAANDAALREAVAERPGMEIRETRAAGHGREIAAVAARQGFDRVVAAGGDGTVGEVLNGLADAGFGPVLGVVPLGTGNDFVRTLGIGADPLAALDALDADVRRRFDLMRVTTGDLVRWGINVATGGFSGQVDEVVTDAMKLNWGPLAYVRGAVDVLPDLTGYCTRIAYDGGEEALVDVFNVLVANGRTCGGGLRVCVGADPEDGLLDVVIVRNAPPVQLATVGARLLTGDWLDHELVEHRRVRAVRIAARPGMWFNVDGEMLTKEPIAFEVVPAAIDVVVGPEYHR